MSGRRLWGTENPDYSKVIHCWTRQKDGTFESLCQLRVRSKHEIGEPSSWHHTCDCCLAMSEKQKDQKAKT